MSRQTLFRDFSRYTAWSVLGTLGVSCYVLADTFFVAKGLGANGLTALNLAIPVYNFIHGTGLMLGMGGATKFSICNARGNQNERNSIFTNTIYLAVIFSAVFLITGLFFSEQLALLFGAKGDVLKMTDTYLRWLLLFAPAFILNDVYLCFLRNDHAPGLSMTAMLIGSFSNIFLDYLFIFIMKMGIFGAVLATGLSPVISLFVMCPRGIRKKNTFHFMKLKPNISIAGQELSLGFPSFLAQLSSGIVMITFNAVILHLQGNMGVAAYSVIANISLVVVAVYTGIAQGVQPLISNSFGQKNSKRVQLFLKYSMITMLGATVALYSLILLFAQPIVSAFNTEGHVQLQQIAETGLRLYFTSSAFVGYNIILATFFTSIDRPFPAHILSVLRGLVIIIPMTLFLSELWGMTGVWLSYPVTELTAAILGFGCLQRLRRLQRR